MFEALILSVRHVCLRSYDLDRTRERIVTRVRDLESSPQGGKSNRKRTRSHYAPLLPSLLCTFAILAEKNGPKTIARIVAIRSVKLLK